MGASSSSPHDLTNLTITAANGTTNHGNQQLLCTPAAWTDILSFFLSNYLTHVATVVTYPGESSPSTLLALTSALLVPTAGVSRGLTAIVRRAKLAKSPLNVAARSGALCMVVRSDTWTWRDGDTVSDAILRGPLVDKEVQLTKAQQKINDLGEKMTAQLIKHSKTFALPKDAMEKKFQPEKTLDPKFKWKNNCDVAMKLMWPPWADTDMRFWRFYDTHDGIVDRKRNVHGSCRLVEGYHLAYVPPDAVILSPADKQGMAGEHAISSDYSLTKALAAIIQLLFALATLYEASGPQIDHYGYAAFALTVAPYALMSLVNLTSTALTPTYPALYMVDSDIMEEARRRGSHFDGVVGRLDTDSPTTRNSSYNCFSVELEFVHEPTGPSTPRLFHLGKASPSLLPTPHPPADPSRSDLLLTHNAEQDSAVNKLKYRELDRQGIAAELSTTGFPINLIHSNNNDNTDEATLFIPVCSNIHRQSPRTWQFNALQFNPISLIPRLPHILCQPHTEMPQQIADITSWLTSLLSLAIYGGLSLFKARQATLAERVITMTWLAFGIVVGPTFTDYNAILSGYASQGWGKDGGASENKAMRLWTRAVSFAMLPVYGAASVAGFVIVGKMVREWGNCVDLY